MRAGAGQVPSLIGNARSTVQARPNRARVKRFLAVRAGVVGRTDASVTPLPGVVAGAIVETGFMVRAIVEVLVAEEPSPALFADAVPGARAGSVHAARVSLALVAQLAHPAGVAAEKKKHRQSRDNERLIRRSEQWCMYCWVV